MIFTSNLLPFKYNTDGSESGKLVCMEISSYQILITQNVQKLN